MYRLQYRAPAIRVVAHRERRCTRRRNSHRVLLYTTGGLIVTLRRVRFRDCGLVLSTLFLTYLLAGCASVAPVSTPFTRNAPDYSAVPVEALREVAREIERQVAEGNREPALQNRDGITVDTPEIFQAVRTRAARVSLVNDFLDTGHGWERRNGRLWIIRSEAYKASGTSRTRDLDALMVNSENLNRWTLYEALIDESGLPSRALSAVEAIFLEARLEFMKPGQKYEDANGEAAIKE